MNNLYPIVPVILALGAFISGTIYWLIARRRHQDTDLDATAFLLVGVAWIIIGLVFQQANLGSFGSVFVLTGMGIGFYRRLA
jgi:hypothetical protein